jgi:uncharacterized membrane protein
MCNIIGLCFCGAAFFYMLSGQVRKKSRPLNEKQGSGQINFEGEMALQLIKEQSRTAFEAVSNIINKERLELQELLDGLENNDQAQLNPGNKSQIREVQKEKAGPQDLREKDSRSEQYNLVVALAEQGIDIKTISERLKIARGEVDLILKFGKQRRLDGDSR